MLFIIYKILFFYQDMLKAFDNYKAVLLSANLSSKEFQKADSTEFKELQNRLRKVNLHWEKATRALDNWRKGLQQALLNCQVCITCQLVKENSLGCC